MIINNKMPRSMHLQVISDGKPVPYLVEYNTITKKAVQLVRHSNGNFLVEDGKIVSREIDLPDSYVLDKETGLPAVFEG